MQPLHLIPLKLKEKRGSGREQVKKAFCNLRLDKNNEHQGSASSPDCFFFFPLPTSRMYCCVAYLDSGSGIRSGSGGEDDSSPTRSENGAPQYRLIVRPPTTAVGSTSAAPGSSTDLHVCVVDASDARAKKEAVCDAVAQSAAQLFDGVVRPMIDHICPMDTQESTAKSASIPPTSASSSIYRTTESRATYAQATVVLDGGLSARNRLLFDSYEGALISSIRDICRRETTKAVFLSAVELDEHNQLIDLLDASTRSARSTSPHAAAKAAILRQQIPTVVEDPTERFTAVEETTFIDVSRDAHPTLSYLAAASSHQRHQVFSLVILHHSGVCGANVPNTTLQLVSFVVHEVTRGIRATRHCVCNVASLMESRSSALSFTSTKILFLLKAALTGRQLGAWVALYQPDCTSSAAVLPVTASGGDNVVQQESFKDAFTVTQTLQRIAGVSRGGTGTSCPLRDHFHLQGFVSCILRPQQPTAATASASATAATPSNSTSRSRERGAAAHGEVNAPQPSNASRGRDPPSGRSTTGSYGNGPATDNNDEANDSDGEGGNSSASSNDPEPRGVAPHQTQVPFFTPRRSSKVSYGVPGDAAAVAATATGAPSHKRGTPTGARAHSSPAQLASRVAGRATILVTSSSDAPSGVQALREQERRETDELEALKRRLQSAERKKMAQEMRRRLAQLEATPTIAYPQPAASQQRYRGYGSVAGAHEASGVGNEYVGGAVLLSADDSAMASHVDASRSSTTALTARVRSRLAAEVQRRAKRHHIPHADDDKQKTSGVSNTDGSSSAVPVRSQSAANALTDNGGASAAKLTAVSHLESRQKLDDVVHNYETYKRTMEAALARLRHELDISSTQLKEAKLQVKQKDRSLRSGSEGIHHTTRELEAVTRKLSATEEEMQRMLTEHNQQKAAWKGQRAELNKQIDAHALRINDLQETIGGLEGALSKAREAASSRTRGLTSSVQTLTQVSGLVHVGHDQAVLKIAQEGGFLHPLSLIGGSNSLSGISGANAAASISFSSSPPGAHGSPSRFSSPHAKSAYNHLGSTLPPPPAMVGIPRGTQTVAPAGEDELETVVRVRDDRIRELEEQLEALQHDFSVVASREKSFQLRIRELESDVVALEEREISVKTSLLRAEQTLRVERQEAERQRKMREVNSVSVACQATTPLELHDIVVRELEASVRAATDRALAAERECSFANSCLATEREHAASARQELERRLQLSEEELSEAHRQVAEVKQAAVELETSLRLRVVELERGSATGRAGSSSGGGTGVGGGGREQRRSLGGSGGGDSDRSTNISPQSHSSDAGQGGSHAPYVPSSVGGAPMDTGLHVIRIPKAYHQRSGDVSTTSKPSLGRSSLSPLQISPSGTPRQASRSGTPSGGGLLGLQPKLPSPSTAISSPPPAAQHHGSSRNQAADDSPGGGLRRHHHQQALDSRRLPSRDAADAGGDEDGRGGSVGSVLVATPASKHRAASTPLNRGSPANAASAAAGRRMAPEESPRPAAAVRGGGRIGAIGGAMISPQQYRVAGSTSPPAVHAPMLSPNTMFTQYMQRGAADGQRVRQESPAAPSLKQKSGGGGGGILRAR